MVWDDSKDKEMMFTEELHRQGIVKESIPQWGRKAGVMKQSAGEKPDSCCSWLVWGKQWIKELSPTENSCYLKITLKESKIQQ